MPGGVLVGGSRQLSTPSCDVIGFLIIEAVPRVARHDVAHLGRRTPVFGHRTHGDETIGYHAHKAVIWICELFTWVASTALRATDYLGSPFDCRINGRPIAMACPRGPGAS